MGGDWWAGSCCWARSPRVGQQHWQRHRLFELLLLGSPCNKQCPGALKATTGAENVDCNLFRSLAAHSTHRPVASHEPGSRKGCWRCSDPGWQLMHRDSAEGCGAHVQSTGDAPRREGLPAPPNSIAAHCLLALCLPLPWPCSLMDVYVGCTTERGDRQWLGAAFWLGTDRCGVDRRTWMGDVDLALNWGSPPLMGSFFSAAFCEATGTPLQG